MRHELYSTHVEIHPAELVLGSRHACNPVIDIRRSRYNRATHSSSTATCCTRLLRTNRTGLAGQSSPPTMPSRTTLSRRTTTRSTHPLIDGTTVQFWILQARASEMAMVPSLCGQRKTTRHRRTDRLQKVRRRSHRRPMAMRSETPCLRKRSNGSHGIPARSKRIRGHGTARSQSSDRQRDWSCAGVHTPVHTHVTESLSFKSPVCVGGGKWMRERVRSDVESSHSRHDLAT